MKNYIKELFHPVHKLSSDNSNISKYIEVLSLLFTELRSYIDNIIYSQNVITASGNDLDFLGLKYDLIRLNNENDDNYRDRIIAIMNIQLYSGINKSIIDALTQAGCTDISIIKDYDYTNRVKIAMKYPVDNIDTDYIYYLINRYKQATTIFTIIESISFVGSTFFNTSLQIYETDSYTLLDGSSVLDGSKLLSGGSDTLIYEI